MGSIELSCGWCLYREPEEETSISAFVFKDGCNGSNTFLTELEEDTLVAITSGLAELICPETKLLGDDDASAGDWELLWRELWLLGVTAVVEVCPMPAGLSTVSTFREMEGEASLAVAGEPAGCLASFKEDSKISEE